VADLKFTCELCNAEHDIEDISFGAKAPDPWLSLSEDERADSELSPDLCLIRSEDETHRFVRACIFLPIAGTDREFSWGVWVSLSQASFEEYVEHWEDKKRPALGPYFGRLCTQLPFYPDTTSLNSMVLLSEVGTRPHVELEPSDHLLSVHQREGIPLPELQRMIRELVHN
jgi:hypothetical protein